MAYYEEDDLQRFSDIAKHRPDLFEKFMAWYQACQEEGARSRGAKRRLLALRLRTHYSAHTASTRFRNPVWKQARIWTR